MEELGIRKSLTLEEFETGIRKSLTSSNGLMLKDE